MLQEKLGGVIRAVTEKDVREIYDFVETAFKTAEVSDGTEQDFVLELRKGAYLPELELVMVDKTGIIGHIMFTEQKIGVTDVSGLSSVFTGLLIAPLSVKLEYRNKGVGAALIKEGFKRAKEAGYQAAFLVGNPEYYKRFGFKETGCYGIKNDSEIPDQFVLGCEIVPNSLSGLAGSIKII
ncbi:GNAT family N-acetyltransferase [Clostridium transplantifaecale]|uniref:GNAT family N-acetyltransferase n=1 Tax=Clostridium transplantifaecale TaxID=2479838 RepID=UPI000F6333D9|nr:N-acetyltransferase [Clostridium transplantifaecale]